jgi:ABC-type lipoprotein release transport system permease subunit
VRVDFGTTYNYGSVSVVDETVAARVVNAVKSVENVRDATPVVTMSSWALLNDSGDAMPSYYDTYSFPLVFLSRNSSELIKAYGINGEMPDPGTVAVPKHVADILQIGIGDNITISFRYQNYSYDPNTSMSTVNNTYSNFTLRVNKIWTQMEGFGSQPISVMSLQQNVLDDISLRGNQNPVVLNLDDLEGILSKPPENGTFYGPYSEYCIWIDRDKLINVGDLGSSINNIDTTLRHVNKKLFPFGLTAYSDISNALTSVVPNLEWLKLLFVVLSLPVVGLGTYLSVVGLDLGVTERRREVGILKSRGASNRQVFSYLIVESVTLGALAGVAGLLMGFGISRFLLNVAASFSFNTTSQERLSDIMVNSSTIIYSILFGVLLMVLSSIRPFRRISKADVSESLHHYTPLLTQIEYKARMDIVLISISVLSIASVLVGSNWRFGSGSWITQLAVGILLLVGIVLFPLMPFFLSLGVTRLLTRSSKKLYSKFTLIVKPWTKELHYIVDKNIVRNPRRASNLCLIISLALAFGLFVSVTMESVIGYQRDTIKAEIGSDIRVQAFPRGSSSTIDFSRLDNLSSVPGIERISLVEELSGQVQVYYNQIWGTISLLDVKAYADTVHPGGHLFKDGGSDMLNELKNNGSALVGESWASNYGVEVGDPLVFQYYFSIYDNGSYFSGTSQFPLVVAGIVKGLPGLNGNIFVNRSTLWFMSEKNLTDEGFVLGAIVDVRSGYNSSEVADNVVGIYDDAGFSASSRVLDVELQKLKQDPTYGAIADFLYMEYALSVAIMTVGVGLLIFVAVADREKELACIMARGSSGGQIRKILMGESLTLTVIGLIVGISVGLLTAYLFNTLWAQGSINPIVERRMYFTFVSWGMVLAAIGAILVSSMVATARAGKIKLAEVLRIRGG